VQVQIWPIVFIYYQGVQRVELLHFTSAVHRHVVMTRHRGCFPVRYRKKTLTESVLAVMKFHLLNIPHILACNELVKGTRSHCWNLWYEGRALRFCFYLLWVICLCYVILSVIFIYWQLLHWHWHVSNSIFIDSFIPFMREAGLFHCN